MVDIGKAYTNLFIINFILWLIDCCLITSEQFFSQTNVFESRSGDVYSIQDYAITSDTYNSVAESENNIVICVQ